MPMRRSCTKSWNSKRALHDRSPVFRPVDGNTAASLRDRRTAAALRASRRPRVMPAGDQLVDAHLEMQAQLFVDLGLHRRGGADTRTASSAHRQAPCSTASTARDVAAPVRGLFAQARAARRRSACRSGRGGCFRTVPTRRRRGPADAGGAALDRGPRLRPTDRRRSARVPSRRSRSRAGRRPTGI